MIVGALGIVLELAVWGPRQRRVTRTDGYGDPAAGARSAGAPPKRPTERSRSHARAPVRWTGALGALWVRTG